MYVYLSACTLCIHVCTCVCIRICLRVCIGHEDTVQNRICTHMYLSFSAFTYECMYIHVCVRIYVYMCVCVFVCTSLHIWVMVYTCECTFICIYVRVCICMYVTTYMGCGIYMSDLYRGKSVQWVCICLICVIRFVMI